MSKSDIEDNLRSKWKVERHKYSQIYLCKKLFSCGEKKHDSSRNVFNSRKDEFL
jgi:hypothetical protein